MKKLLGIVVLGLFWCNVGFALPECQGDINKWTNCSYTWSNGNKYVGEWKNSKQHGQGIHTWPNGNKYVGEWKNNEMYGHGTFTSTPGYKICWRNGKMVISMDKELKLIQMEKIIVAIFEKGENCKKNYLPIHQRRKK